MKSGNFLETSDKVKIAYNWYPVDNPRGYSLLIHMMPATKESWKGFAEEMAKEGYESLAIDLRGHGESEGGPSGYQKFSDEEHQKSILDVEAAIGYLKELGADWDKIAIIGASIGANLALQALTNHKVIKKAVLLSAGLNYRGIGAEPLVKKLSAGQGVLFFSSEDDQRAGGNNVEMNQRLYDLVPPGVEKEIVIYKKGGHGTDFLDQAKGVIRDYLARRL